MMEKKSDKVHIYFTLGTLIIFVISYFLLLDVQINVNRSLSMLEFDDSKGVLMYYYGLQGKASLAAVAIIFEQTMLPMLSKGAIVFSNLRFFGSYGALLVFIISVMPIWPSAFLGYLFGIVRLSFKKFLLAVCIGELICLLVFFK